MRTLVIANACAGGADAGRRLAEIALGAGWSWLWPTSSVEAARLARDASAHGFERVVAAGGDGTVHAVVQGIMSAERRPLLAVLPLGTGNDVARTLGFSMDPEDALAQLYEAHTRRLDLAIAEVGASRRYLVNSSAGGLSGEVDRIVEREDKVRWGPLAYVRGALDLIRDLPAYDLDVRVDGELVDRARCVGFVTSIGRTIGGGLRVAPTADPEDGLLDLLLVESAPRVALAAVGAQLKTGGVLSNPLAHHHLGAHIELVSDPAMPINVDGELIGDVVTARFDVLPRAIEVCVGPAYLGRPELGVAAAR